MNNLASGDLSVEVRIGQAANEFFGAVSRGEMPSITEFAGRYPDISEHIRSTFPALLLVGNISIDEQELVSPQPYGDRSLGDFKIICELGRGGMGTVFEAEQVSMGRLVALKVLPFAAIVHEKSLQRFRNEVRAAAALNHPHIVPVYSIGEERGVHFYAMQLVRGRTLADMIEELRKASRTAAGGEAVTIEASVVLPPRTKRDAQAQISTAVDSRRGAESFRTAARLGIQAADALQHAHDQGVLHRDIKPGNLMLDGDGKLFVTDFGLARIEADAGLTITGDILGTLRYMAPEQALAKRVVIDHRADIYSLGATLYELLTLQPAFDETDRSELLKQIAFEEPVPLRRINPRIPAELETIVLKAIAKEPNERYQTAQLLADDLQAYLEHRPITARPASLVDRLRKWSRRREKLVRAVGLASVLLALIFAAGMVILKRAQTQAVAALEKTSDLLYTADMAVAYQSFEKGWSDEVQTILDRYIPTTGGLDRRGFEWQLLQSRVQQPASFTLAGHEGSINELAVFPDRRRLASVGQDGTVRIWDVRARRLLQTITIGEEALDSIAISPDGRFVAAGSTVVYLCDLQESEKISEIFHNDVAIESLVFSANGKYITAGARYDEVCMLSLDGKVESRVPCASRVESLEYVSHSPLLLVPNRRPVADQQPILGIVELWREGLSSVEQELDGSHDKLPGQITIARSSPCGKFVAAGERYRSRAYLFELTSGNVLAETPVSRDRLTDLAYSPDGKGLAIGYRNGRIEYFELAQNADGLPSIKLRPLVVRAHQGEVMSVRFIDSKTLASCGNDGLLRIWDLPTTATSTFDLNAPKMSGLQLSPNGSLLLYVSQHEYLFANVENGEVLFRHSRPNADFKAAAWSPMGDKAAVASGEANSVTVFDRSGRTLATVDHASPEAVAFSPDGSIVAIIGAEQLQLCRADNGKDIFRKVISSHGYAIQFSHDGSRLAYGGQSGAIFVMDLKSMRPLHEAACGSDTTCMAFSHDDSMIATGHDDAIIRLWNADLGQRRTELVGHERRVNNVVFSPDGRTLLSSGGDNAIRLWSVDNGRSYGIIDRRFEPGPSDPCCRLSISTNWDCLVFGYVRPLDYYPDLVLWRIRPAISN